MIWILGWNQRVIRFDNAKTKGNGGSADAVLSQSGFGLSGEGSGPSGMNNPVGVSIDNTANRLFVSDFSNNVCDLIPQMN